MIDYLLKQTGQHWLGIFWGSSQLGLGHFIGAHVTFPDFILCWDEIDLKCKLVSRVKEAFSENGQA